MKKLERSLPLYIVIAISIGGMLGSGIFVLPGIAAVQTGPSVWLAYLLAGMCVLPAVLSKSELATAMPTSGGTYVYIERAFGPAMGTITGLGLWLSLLLKSSFALVGFGAYLSIFADLPLRSISLAFLSVVIFLNIMGVKKVGNVQVVIVIVSLISLSLILLFGMPQVKPENMDPFMTHGNGGLIAAAAFVFISYAGVTKVAAIAEEIKNPGRNLPLAMMISFAVVMTIYVLTTYTLVGNIPVEELATDIRPIYTLVEYLGGSFLGYLAAGLGVITLISMANSGVLAASRFPFAMSRDKLLPPVFSKIHARFSTPIVTILITGAVMALVIIFFDVKKIAKLASAFMVMMFMLENVCVVIFRETAVQWYKPNFQSPFYPWVQLFGIISGFILLVLLGAMGIFAGLLVAIIGFGVYFFYGKSKVQRRGILVKYGQQSAAAYFFKKSKTKLNSKIENIPLIGEDEVVSHIEEYVTDEEGVVVPLFGKEYSPEMLAEIGAAIGGRNPVHVVSLTEIPDQIDLDAMLEDDPLITSINRRISAVAAENNVNVTFEADVTHDLTSTVKLISDRAHCQWMVMGWDGKAGDGLLVRNPIGWLISHINVKLALFKDKGVRSIHHILVSMHPHRNDESMVEVADRIAQFYGASIHLLRVIPEHTSKDDIQKLNHRSQRLLNQCAAQTEVIIKEDNHPIKAIELASASYDLLILGTPEKKRLFNLLLGTKKDPFTDRAACSVLRLTFPEE